MGVVYRARFASPDERERFHREAQAAARPHHPGIVGIIDVGETEGVPWFCMEHIAGGSLEHRVREHPMESSEAARWLRDVARAVQHAHDHGVLHRDLKLSNMPGSSTHPASSATKLRTALRFQPSAR